jgi:hypothetical protein
VDTFLEGPGRQDLGLVVTEQLEQLDLGAESTSSRASSGSSCRAHRRPPHRRARGRVAARAGDLLAVKLMGASATFSRAPAGVAVAASSGCREEGDGERRRWAPAGVAAAASRGNQQLFLFFSFLFLFPFPFSLLLYC